MKENIRKPNGLTLDGEDLFVNGNLFVDGPVTIKNCTVIVCGNAFFCNSEYIHLNYANIIVAGKLEFTTTSVIATGCGDLSANEIICSGKSFGSEYDGNILADDWDIFTKEDLSAGNISADIVSVGRDTFVVSISCTDIFISRYNKSKKLSAVLDIYIGDVSYSTDIVARDIFIGSSADCDNIIAQNLYIEGDADFNNCGLTVSGDVYIGGEISNLQYIPAKI